jgi:hypothetical protein
VIPDYLAELLFAIDMRLDLFDECLATEVHLVT